MPIIRTDFTEQILQNRFYRRCHLSKNNQYIKKWSHGKFCSFSQHHDSPVGDRLPCNQAKIFPSFDNCRTWGWSGGVFGQRVWLLSARWLGSAWFKSDKSQKRKKDFWVDRQQSPFSISSSFLRLFVLLPFFLKTKIEIIPLWFTGCTWRWAFFIFCIYNQVMSQTLSKNHLNFRDFQKEKAF